MLEKEYKITGPVPWFGLGCLLLLGYLTMFWGGCVSWKLSPWMKELSFSEDPVLLWIVAILGLGCVLLVWSSRLKVKVATTGIEYRGFVGSTVIKWSDVKRLSTDSRGSTIHLWIDGRHLSISTMFGRCRELPDLIVAKAAESGVKITPDENPIPFWRRRKSHRSRAGTRKEF